MKARLFTDGGSRGNPGPSAFAYVLVDEDRKVITSGKQMIGINTNNIAEYSGLLVGLDEALRHGVTQLEVLSDSKLMIEQMSGRYRVKSHHLKKLHKEANRLINKFERIEFTWIKRYENKETDKMVNDSLDGILKWNGIEKNQS